ncbi:hypothetical protein IG631_22193 [Alternaria alternata]|nr:hypothetical protein IG631_22193 [Alternaria alternata]
MARDTRQIDCEGRGDQPLRLGGLLSTVSGSLATPRIYRHPSWPKQLERLREPQRLKSLLKFKVPERPKPRSRPYSILSANYPPELRAKIWAIALEDQKELVPDDWSVDTDFGNTVTIHEHEEMDGEKHSSILSTRGYPTLFAVNRKARYEAAKVDGGAWYTLGTEAPEVYVTLDKERVYFAMCCKSLGLRGTRLYSKSHGTRHCIHFLLSKLERDMIRDLIR